MEVTINPSLIILCHAHEVGKEIVKTLVLRHVCRFVLVHVYACTRTHAHTHTELPRDPAATLHVHQFSRRSQLQT